MKLKPPEDKRLKWLAYSLLGLGVLIIVINSGMLSALPAFSWLILLLIAGASFWVGGLRQLPLWVRIVGFSGIGVLAIVTSGRFSASAALSFPAMAFLMIYITNPKRWWAIIPGGVLASVALLVTFESLFRHWDTTPILFLGFAATFSYLYLLPKKRGGKRWALYPAILFIILTVLVNDPSGQLEGWFLPLVLIGSGALVLWWWRQSSK